MLLLRNTLKMKYFKKSRILNHIYKISYALIYTLYKQKTLEESVERNLNLLILIFYNFLNLILE